MGPRSKFNQFSRLLDRIPKRSFSFFVNHNKIIQNSISSSRQINEWKFTNNDVQTEIIIHIMPEADSNFALSPSFSSHLLRSFMDHIRSSSLYFGNEIRSRKLYLTLSICHFQPGRNGTLRCSHRFLIWHKIKSNHFGDKFTGFNGTFRWKALLSHVRGTAKIQLFRKYFELNLSINRRVWTFHEGIKFSLFNHGFREQKSRRFVLFPFPSGKRQYMNHFLSRRHS
jgi:hypothetical protein